MLRLAVVLGLSVIATNVVGIHSFVSLPLAVIIYLVSGGWTWIRLVVKTLPRDMFIIRVVIGSIIKMIKIKKNKAKLSNLFYECVAKNPDKVGLISADTNETLTFKEAELLCHKIANVFYQAGYRKGDTVALLMENRIEYMLIWLGLSMIGVITSLINHNLRGESLLHCINVCQCKAIIFSKELSETLKEIEDDLNIQFYSFDEEGGDLFQLHVSLYNLMQSASTLPPPNTQDLSDEDLNLYLYTSGTTGLPKAVKWRNSKNIYACIGIPLYGMRDDDIFFCPLPLYHGSGLAISCAFFMYGCTVVVKKRFSASTYIADCCKYHVTAINYIGETCRYILNQPESELEKTNRIRWAIGNGLRATIWSQFQDRFGIDIITEFYASTEGNTNIFPNQTGRIGAVGFLSLLLPNRDLKLVKMDKYTGEILRGPDGVALEARIGEPGQAVGRITKIQRFDGYTNESDTEKKITRDVFSKGDSAFLTGDILRRDEEGFYYFIDRTGDTFRWKGENVSTNQVEGLLNKITQITDVCVYGVEIPGEEGKAGMAFICDREREMNVNDFPQLLEKHLPKYAHPVFLRLSSSSIGVTSTFKYQKRQLQMDSFDPQACVGDDLYYFSRAEKKYLHLDSDVYHQIMQKYIQF